MKTKQIITDTMEVKVKRAGSKRGVHFKCQDKHLYFGIQSIFVRPACVSRGFDVQPFCTREA